MKRCPKCGLDLPLTRHFFAPAKGRPGGYAGYCRVCCRDHMREHREKVGAIRFRCASCGDYFTPKDGESCCSEKCCRAFEGHLADMMAAESRTLDPICRCGAKLWAETNYLGEVGDWCPTCGYRKLIERRVACGS